MGELCPASTVVPDVMPGKDADDFTVAINGIRADGTYAAMRTCAVHRTCDSTLARFERLVLKSLY